MTDRWLVKPGGKFRLEHVDPGTTEGAPGDKKQTAVVVDELLHRMLGLQDRLWAEHERALLVVLQALDGGGKDGTIKHVFTGVNPQGTRVTSFKAPTPEELDHDFLWRVHKVTPGHGEIGIFNRSHYEDVLVVRVHELVPESVWRDRYDIINAFEHGLAAAGTTIVKFWLHMSRDEQRKRFEERLADPAKRWKFKRADLEERKRWDDYQAAAEEMIRRTSTDDAPWHVIPADRNWYRNWAVSAVLVDTLEAMDPQYPQPDDLDGITVE